MGYYEELIRKIRKNYNFIKDYECQLRDWKMDLIHSANSFLPDDLAVFIQINATGLVAVNS